MNGVKSTSNKKAASPAAKSTATQRPPSQEMQQDPSNPGRFVKSKKPNQAMLAHQRWKEKERQKQSNSKSPPPEPISIATLLKWFFLTLLSAAALGHFITGDVLYGYNGRWRNPRKWIPVKQRVFTPSELALYNGRDASRPVYLAILGNVYDVTAGGETYTTGGSYDFFAGRDASRAFTTGCFQTHLTHDLRGLSDSEVEVSISTPVRRAHVTRSLSPLMPLPQQIRIWNSFFANHPKYFVRVLCSRDPPS